MSMFLEAEVRQLITAWETAALPEVAELVGKLKESIGDADHERMAYQDVVAAADAKYANNSDGDIEIDEGALISVGSYGVWVQAWLYMSNDEVKESGT